MTFKHIKNTEGENQLFSILIESRARQKNKIAMRGTGVSKKEELPARESR